MSIDTQKYRLAYITLNSSKEAILELINLVNLNIDELKEGKHYYFHRVKRMEYNQKLVQLKQHKYGK